MGKWVPEFTVRGTDDTRPPYPLAVSTGSCVNRAGFAVEVDAFQVGGASSSGSAVYSNNNRVVTLSGGGYCGWICSNPATFNPYNDGGDFQLALEWIPPS